MNNILQKTNELTENMQKIHKQYFHEKVVKTIRCIDEDILKELKSLGITDFTNNLLSLVMILVSIYFWRKENACKKINRVFPSKIIGGNFELNDYEKNYIYLSILQIPFNTDMLDIEMYNVLKEISESVVLYERHDNISEYMKQKRSAKYN